MVETLNGIVSFFTPVWSREFGPLLITQVIVALVGTFFFWRAAFAFSRPAPWVWLGLLFLLWAARPMYLLLPGKLVDDPRLEVVLDAIIMPVLFLVVMIMASLAVSRELRWHYERDVSMSDNLVQLKKIVDEQKTAASSIVQPPHATTNQEYVEQYVEQLQNLIRLWANAAAAGIVTVGEDGVIRYANPGAHTLFRYRWGSLLGRPLTDLIPPELRERHLIGFKRYLETGQRTLQWKDLRFNALCGDDATRPVTLTFIEHRLLEDRVFTGVITERNDD